MSKTIFHLLLCLASASLVWAVPELTALRVVRATDVPVQERANFNERSTKDVKGNGVEGFFGKSPILIPADFDLAHASIVKSAVEDKVDIKLPLTAAGQAKLENWTQGHIGEQVAVLIGQTVLSALTIVDRVPGPIHIIGLEEQNAKELLSQITGNDNN